MCCSGVLTIGGQPTPHIAAAPVGSVSFSSTAQHADAAAHAALSGRPLSFTAQPVGFSSVEGQENVTQGALVVVVSLLTCWAVAWLARWILSTPSIPQLAVGWVIVFDYLWVKDLKLLQGRHSLVLLLGAILRATCGDLRATMWTPPPCRGRKWWLSPTLAKSLVQVVPVLLLPPVEVAWWLGC